MRSAVPFFANGSDFKISGTNRRKSCKRLERVSKTRTAISNWERCCWNERLESTVRKISNSFSASARSFPFLNEAHPICGTVLTKWPDKSRASFRSTHSSMRIFTSNCCEHPFFGLFQKSHHLFSRNGRKSIQKFINRVAALDVVDQRFRRNSCSRETRRAAHDFTIGDDNLLFHISTIHEP